MKYTVQEAVLSSSHSCCVIGSWTQRGNPLPPLSIHLCIHPTPQFPLLAPCLLYTPHYSHTMSVTYLWFQLMNCCHAKSLSQVQDHAEWCQLLAMQESLTHSRHWRDTSRQAHIDDFSLFAVAAYKSPLNMHSYIWSSSVTALVAFYFLLGNDSYLHDFIKKNLFAYCLKASSKKRISPDILPKKCF